MQQNDVVLVLTNMPDAQQARDMAQTLVELGLAACVTVGAPVYSVYRWQGAIEQSTEIPLLIKTTLSQKGPLMERLVSLHPYDVPEVLVLPALDGHAPYLDWVREATSVCAP